MRPSRIWRNAVSFRKKISTASRPELSCAKRSRRVGAGAPTSHAQRAGSVPPAPAISDRELLPGPAAERVGERFEVEGGRHGHEEGRPVEGQRREEIPGARAAGSVRRARGTRRLRGLLADERGRLFLREDVAKRAAQVVEKVGGGADGRARRADPRRRVDRRRSGSLGAAFAPEEALPRRGEGREAGAREPGLVAAERERSSCRRGRAERRTNAPRANRGEGEGGPPALPPGRRGGRGAESAATAR